MRTLCTRACGWPTPETKGELLPNMGHGMVICYLWETLVLISLFGEQYSASFHCSPRVVFWSQTIYVCAGRDKPYVLLSVYKR